MNANVLNLVGRIGLALIFVTAGFSKITGYDATAGYMESMGVPSLVLPLVILLELGGGLAIIAGFFTKPIALALAAFSVAAAVLFHGNTADQLQMIMFMKNIGLAGGFLLLAANGPGAYSVDAKRA